MSEQQTHLYQIPVAADRAADFEWFRTEVVEPAVQVSRPELVGRWLVPGQFPFLGQVPCLDEAGIGEAPRIGWLRLGGGLPYEDITQPGWTFTTSQGTD